jgi:hypothetical protein
MFSRNHFFFFFLFILLQTKVYTHFLIGVLVEVRFLTRQNLCKNF